MSWTKSKLGHICDISIGKTPSRKNLRYWDGEKTENNPWLSISDLSSIAGKTIGDSKEYISSEGAKLCKKVKKDTLVMSFKLSIGKLAFLERDLYTNEAIAAFDIKNKETITPQYLYYYLYSYDWDNETSNDRKLMGRTLNKKKLNEIPIIFPPITVQKQIVEKLDKAFAGIDKAISATQKNIENAEALLQSYLRHFFGEFPFADATEKLRQKEELIIDGEYVTAWRKTDLAEASVLITRGISPKYMDVGGIRVLNQKCVRNHEINYELARRHDSSSKPVKEERYIKEGDVLINSTGTGTLGRVAQVKIEPNEPTTVDSHVTIIRPNSKMFDLNLFGYALIKLEPIFQDAGLGSGGQTELSRKNLLSGFDFTYPESIAMQRKIAQKLDLTNSEIEMLLDACQRKLINLAALKYSMLAQALSSDLIKAAS